MQRPSSGLLGLGDWHTLRTWICCRYTFFEVGVDDEVRKDVYTGHSEDGMEVDDSMSTIGGGAADDDAGRCDGRGREGWEVITTYKLSCHRADDEEAPHMS